MLQLLFLELYLLSCFYQVSPTVCVIKWRLNWLFFVPKITHKGSDLLALFETVTKVQLFETPYNDFLVVL